MDVFELVAKLTLDTQGYDDGLDSAESKASGFGSALKSGLGGAAKIGAAAVAATTAAIAAGTSALVGGAASVAEYGDNIDKMSQKMGISAEAYQEWDAIMQHSGTSIDSMSRGMQTLQKNAVNSADKFEQLGITQEQLASMSTEELFSATITGLQNMGEGAERTALASELLGGSAKELGALLNTSAEDTENMRQRVHELGGVMSDEAVAASAKFQDTLQDMTTGIDSLKRNMLSEFLPSITGVMEGLTDIFTGNEDIGLEKIQDNIVSFIDRLTENIPKVLNVGMGIITALGEGIIQNLPALTDAAVQIIGQFGDFIMQNLPILVEAALQIILTLANGMSQSLPEMIPTIVDVIMQITNILIDNIDLLIDAGIAIILALIDGVVVATPRIIEQMPEIVLKLLDAIIQAAPTLLQGGVELVMSVIAGVASAFGALVQIGVDAGNKFGEGLKKIISGAVQWGKDMISGFVDGIKAGWDKLKNAVSGVAQGIKDRLGFSEPKIGPLHDFHSYAPDMIDLFVSGINSNANKVKTAMESLAGDVSDNFDLSTPNFEYAGDYGVSRNTTTVSSGGLATTASRDLTVILELERTQLAKAVYRLNNEETQRVGVRLAGGTV